MNKNSRLFFKVLFTMIGLLIIVYILTVSIRMNMIKQPEGEYIRVQDALILTEALDVKYTKEDIFLDLQNETDKDRDIQLTYNQFIRLIAMITEKSGDKDFIDHEGNKVQDIASECKKEYHKYYKDDFYFLKKDWYQFYNRLLTYYNMESKIVLVNIIPLGTGADVTDAEGKVFNANELLAEDGRYLFRSNQFLHNKYQVLKVYKKEDVLLTIYDTVSRSYQLDNIWLMEAGESKLQAFIGGYDINFTYEKAEQSQREQVADFIFADGILQTVKVKNEKVNGKLLSMRDNMLEIEGYGKYPYSDQMKVYKLYGNLEESTQKDLRIGYDFTDFIIDDGVICAGLITRDEAMENIRVVVKNSDFSSNYHEEIELTADTDFSVKYGAYDSPESKAYKAGEIVTIDSESEYFKEDRLYIEPSALTGHIRLLSVQRAQGTPEYRGKLEIAKTEEGLIIVNELLLEEYLYSVVPSEMPASYPLEALKAQAVCARTYAYKHMAQSNIAGLGAHVDDSVGYQVYNNIAENSQSTKAVRETTGELLYSGDELCSTYYYSTSCGFGSDINVWKSGSGADTSYLTAKRIGTDTDTIAADEVIEEEVFESFINSSYVSDYEKEEAWYRWTYEVKDLDEEKILALMQKRYEANENLILTKDKNGDYISSPVKKLGKIKNIYIDKRGPGGVADELIIEGTNKVYKIISEYNIRYVLNDGESKTVRQDGSETASSTLLPSAYFVIKASKEKDVMIGYTIVGGGYGHGVGMSQNAAKSMAAKGLDAQNILTFFYQACEVKKAY